MMTECSPAVVLSLDGPERVLLQQVLEEALHSLLEKVRQARP
jgi:hypothetical protein